jgi:hypothetical protein
MSSACETWPLDMRRRRRLSRTRRPSSSNNPRRSNPNKKIEDQLAFSTGGGTTANRARAPNCSGSRSPRAAALSKRSAKRVLLKLACCAGSKQAHALSRTVLRSSIVSGSYIRPGFTSMTVLPLSFLSPFRIVTLVPQCSRFGSEHFLRFCIAIFRQARGPCARY